MKPFLTILILAGSLCSIPAEGRTLRDINVISPRVLQRSVSPKFFKSLLISPVDGWIVVRANVIKNNSLSGARILRSELNGAYDQLALQLANDLEIAGLNRMENPHTGGPSVLVHLLVYQIADGTMVLSFPTFDDAGGNQLWYWGCSRLAVIKKDGRWVEIEGPEGLHAKGWAVRGVTDQFNNDRGPWRPKERLPKFTPPGASVLGPIIASTRR